MSKHTKNRIDADARARQEQFLQAMGLTARPLTPSRRTPAELSARLLRENRQRDQRRHQQAVAASTAQAEAAWTRSYSERGRKSSRTCSRTRSLVAQDRDRRIQEGNLEAERAWALQYANKE